MSNGVTVGNEECADGRPIQVDAQVHIKEPAPAVQPVLEQVCFGDVEGYNLADCLWDCGG